VNHERTEFADGRLTETWAFGEVTVDQQVSSQQESLVRQTTPEN
jgi:hypothetical protein